MSRYYEMDVEVSHFASDRRFGIEAAAESEWPFGEWVDCGDDGIQSTGRDSLCGGEGEQEFSDRLAAAIMRANGAPCDVTVTATYLENLPRESYTFDGDDYDRLMMMLSIKEE